jgi:hypothetical protein
MRKKALPPPICESQLTPGEIALEEIITKVLIPGLEAKKTGYVTYKGVVTDTYEDIDHDRRLRCFDLYCNLLGLYD